MLRMHKASSYSFFFCLVSMFLVAADDKRKESFSEQEKQETVKTIREDLDSGEVSVSEITDKLKGAFRLLRSKEGAGQADLIQALAQLYKDKIVQLTPSEKGQTPEIDGFLLLRQMLHVLPQELPPPQSAAFRPVVKSYSKLLTTLLELRSISFELTEDPRVLYRT